MAKIKKNQNLEEQPAIEKKTSLRGSPSIKKSTRGENRRDIVQLIQQDGKLYNKKNVKSLDELLGEEVGKYSTSNIKEYESMLDTMNTSDLQRHAISVQILPKEDRKLLVKLLLKQFQINNSVKLNKAKEIPISQKPISQEVLDILSEGR